jgi:hypothetical protein
MPAVAFLVRTLGAELIDDFIIDDESHGDRRFLPS